MMDKNEARPAIRSERAHRHPALGRKPRPSVAQLEASRRNALMVADCFAFMAIGAVLMYVFIHVAKAFL